MRRKSKSVISTFAFNSTLSAPTSNTTKMALTFSLQLTLALSFTLITRSNALAYVPSLKATLVDSSAQTLNRKIQAAVQKSLTANLAATSAAEWESSEHSPHVLFNQIQNFVDSQSQSQNDMLKNASLACASLRSLSDLNLSVFEEEINASEYPFLAGCEKELTRRIQTHHDADKKQFAEFVRKQNVDAQRSDTGLLHKIAVDRKENLPGDQADLTQSDRSTRYDACAGNPLAMGTSRTIEIDTTGGPAFGNYRGHPRIPGLQDRELVITLDDGPHSTRTPRALQALREHCVKTAIFSVGYMAKASPQLIQQSYLEGHVIANHTWDHQYLPKLSAEAGEKQIDDGFDILRTVLAQIPSLQDPNIPATVAPFFRFPGGNETPAALTYLQQNNIASFTWDAGADDWLPITAEESYKRALQQIEQVRKGIFLIHDVQEKTVTMLPELLNELARRGYKAVQIVPKQP